MPQFHKSRTPFVAFTLLELLVVICILGFLIAILMPAMDRAKERGWLLRGVRDGKLEHCRKAVKEGKIRPKDYPMFLGAAAQNGQLALCKYFVEELKTPVSDSEFLYQAAQSGKDEVIQYIFDKGSVIDSTRVFGGKNTMLHAACRGGNIEFCKKVLAMKPAVEAVNDENMTPLWYAANGGYEDAFQLLIDAGAVVDIQKMNRDGMTLLHVAARGGSGKICRFLLDKGCNVNIKASPNCYNKLPIHFAASASRPDATRVLIEAGADINARDTQHGGDGKGFSPIMYAGMPQYAASLGLLIRAGAEHDIHHRYTGGTLIELAVEGGDVELCQFLVNEGVSKDQRYGYYQDTLLHLAARSGQAEVCRWLIENGADVNVRNKQNGTPLISAATSNRVSAAEILLEAGADPRLENINGNALSAAQIQSKPYDQDDHRDYSEIIKLLESYTKEKDN
jgi:ankyrin repeat protein